MSPAVRAAVLALACLVAAPALAALSPWYQRQKELERIITDARVMEALKSEPIEAIEYTGEDLYRVYAGSCAVEVTIVDVPGGEDVMGPRRFDLEVGAADCAG
ncbi:hypothetical protein CSC94_03330 [Zhengella mangrovi]|uniref:PepSY domain-containing protein n=1 Tax=Zhengella mangrovi TaxID=1982044 RepID=A0A2G1QU66_9HYPH|nr:hypothetical protein [Zhengella mangrovi]PHP69025.1 hypothetical protein CSC94_03330 [Zhengella mangrovi]